jgi:oxygen-independent coproporphyrinogen-3 oxidase
MPPKAAVNPLDALETLEKMETMDSVKTLETMGTMGMMGGSTPPLKNRDNFDLSQFFANPQGDPKSSAFSRKFTVHAGTFGQTLTGSLAKETFNELLANYENEPLGLYIHIPFCQNHCLYCGFAGQNPEAELLEKYTAALTSEINHLAQKMPSRPGPVRTIYFGGGTPTILSPRQLTKITSCLQKNFSLANDAEMTLEGRVSDLTPENVLGFLEAGFNRFSLGVQSFDTSIRKSLGRHSEKQAAIKFLENLIKPQRAAVIIDLIYGLPGQDLDSFLEDLQTADLIGVDGLDTYQLNTFPGGNLEKAVLSGRLKAPAPINRLGDYYALAYDFLQTLHWRSLSLSHYARDTRERNIYNPWAKTHQTCLAIGAGAGGFLADHSTYRLPTVEDYFAEEKSDAFAPTMVTQPSGHEAISSLIVSQMERGYLDLAETFILVPKARNLILTLADNWSQAGLVSISQDTMSLSLAGRIWGVNLTHALVVTATEAFHN